MAGFPAPTADSPAHTVAALRDSTQDPADLATVDQAAFADLPQAESVLPHRPGSRPCRRPGLVRLPPGLPAPRTTFRIGCHIVASRPALPPRGLRIPGPCIACPTTGTMAATAGTMAAVAAAATISASGSMDGRAMRTRLGGDGDIPISSTIGITGITT